MPEHAPEHAARLARLDRLADQLDARFRFFGIRFGWDSILGLLPGVGDVASAAPGVYIITEAARMGARRRVLARMGLNTAADVVIGGIPVLGDAFDVAFKANRRNIALLKREMARDNPYLGHAARAGQTLSG
nr:DUF4112 domain-containing protein [Roseibacterium elongatum]